MSLAFRIIVIFVVAVTGAFPHTVVEVHPKTTSQVQVIGAEKEKMRVGINVKMFQGFLVLA
ncbi:hypothetical protein N7522_012483 [Penicillium canescens]|nr:hypothetical protein N7522_012483 [Penicillium canescens]